MTPLVSTIIPAYNAERWIGAAIQSALGQGVEQEIIVIDDGSTDGTARVAEGFGAPVVVHSQRNSGVSQARNLGLHLAKGNYIAFLDADDFWFPSKLTKQLAAFAAFPEAGTVICDEAHVTDQGTVIHESFFATRSFAAEIPSGPAVLPKPLTWLVKESFFPTSSVIARRSVALKAGDFDPTLRIVEDRDYWIRLALHGPVAVVPEVLLRYRTGGNQGLSVANRSLWVQSLKTVLDRHADTLLDRLPSEGTDGRIALGEQYLMAARECWYSDQFEEASALFASAARFGVADPLRHLASRWHLAPLARRLKGFLTRAS